MRTFVQALLVAALLAIPLTAYGQVGFTLSGGISLPTGDYGNDSGVGAGLATTGFTLLGHVMYSIPRVANLAWIGSAGFSTHGDNDDLADALVDIGGTNVQVGRYWEIPLLTGLRYDVPISEGGHA